MNIFNYLELKYDKLDQQIRNWLGAIYNKNDITFNSASPHGQIVNLQKEFFQHNILYLKNAVNQIDIENSYNEKVIRSIARISGHNATRSIAAKGVIKLKLKDGLNLTSDTGGSGIIITNHTLLKNQTNGLYYSIQTNEENSTYSFANTKEIYLNVIQGKYETKTFTGTGLPYQSFSVNIANNLTIENFEISVMYNSYNLTIKDSLFDLSPNAYECYTRTGMNGGLDVYFGSDSFGFVPIAGSIITVTYLVTDGSLGDITNRTMNDFKFIDQVTSIDGDSIVVEDYFDIVMTTDITFSSDGESIDFTKSIIPYVSRNFVLATPEQFVYALKRLNIFSQVYAYNLLNDYDTANKNSIIEGLKNDVTNNVVNTINKESMLSKIEYLSELNITNDNKIMLYLVPDIRKYFTKEINYFNITLDAFYLDDVEQQKVLDYLKMMGTLMITSDVEIVQPTITYYAINVFVNRYDDTVESNVREDIINTISDYFIRNQRYDRIVRSDIIKTLKLLNSVDSVDITFISQSNEIYHKEGMIATNTSPAILEKPIIIKNETVYSIKNYDPTLTIGLDPIMGDILVGTSELPVIRGGWYDRNGIYYTESISETSIGPVNIMFNEKIKRTN
jgi:hypothetical protein